MRTVLRMVVSAAVIAAATLAAAAPASAAPATGSLSFSGDAGDYISGGQSYTYDSAAGDSLYAGGSTSNGNVSISVDGANGDWWYLDFAAPAGQALVPGTYTGATRYPFQDPNAPGLNLSGNGRGCNTSTGSFVVTAAVFGPNGYVKTFDATYEQHCEGGTAALRGEVHISNPEPPAPLELGVHVATSGSADALNGNAYLNGTVTCTAPATVYVDTALTQVVKRSLARGNASTSVQCVPGTVHTWNLTITPAGDVPFVKGAAEARVSGAGYDTEYQNYVRVSETVVVDIAKK